MVIKFLELKQCKTCLIFKSFSLFYHQKANSDGLRSDCKVCVNIKACKWQKENKDKVLKRKQTRKEEIKQYNKEYKKDYIVKNRDKILKQRRKRRIKRLYNLEYNEYLAMIEAQNNLCIICEKGPNGKHKKLCIDHCHETGRVRGLLCVNCNRAIGYLQDDPELAIRLAEYLLKFLKKEK